MIETPSTLWSLPARHIGRRVLIYDSLPSTNDFAIQIAAESDAVGTCVLAREQTAGRGQYGRAWHSPPGGGVWFSVLLQPPAQIRRPAVLTAWAAVTVAEVIREIVNRQAVIKWPNDLLVGGKKICGILIEQGRNTVVGVGLNVNQSQTDFVNAGLSDATSLAALASRQFDVDEMARIVILALDREYDSLLAGDLPGLEACWKWRVGLLGQPVLVEAFDGRTIRGRLLEMAFAGLVIEQFDGQLISLAPEAIRQITEMFDSLFLLRVEG